MTATAHILVGGAIAAAIPNPTIGLTLSAISHPFLDMIPHWDEGWGWRNKSKARLFSEAAIDLSVGILLAYFLFGPYVQSFPYLLGCMFLSIVWDLAEAPYLILNWKFAPFYFFYKMQSKIQGKVKLPWGILTQVVTVSLIILILQTFR